MTEPTTETITETTTETIIQDMPSLSVVVEEGNGYTSFSVRLEFADMPETATLPQLVGEVVKQILDATTAKEWVR